MKELFKRYGMLSGLIAVSLCAMYALYKCWHAEFGIPVAYAEVQPYNPAYAIQGISTNVINTYYRRVDARSFLKANNLRGQIRRMCWELEFSSLGLCEVEQFTVFSDKRILVAVKYGQTETISWLYINENGGWRKVPMRR